MRPDEWRSGGAGHAEGGAEPRVCGGNSGEERRSAPPGGDDGVEPRSGGSERVPGGDDGREPRSGGVPVGDGRGDGDGRVPGWRDDESFDPGGEMRPDEPRRRDDESSLTRELLPGSNVTTSW